MRTRTIIIAGSSLLLIISLAVLLCLRGSQQPTYGGKKLSQWLADLNYSGDPADVSAQAAVKAIGTNALPHILPMLCAQDSSFELNVMRLLRKQSLIKISWIPASEKRQRAARAVRALGSEGASAAPALVTMLDTKEDAWCAMAALVDIGPDGLPGLTKALTNQNVRIRQMVSGHISKHIAEPGTSAALIALTNALSDADIEVRRRAATAILKLAATNQEPPNGGQAK